jgi:hypothetical protein
MQNVFSRGNSGNDSDVEMTVALRSVCTVFVGEKGECIYLKK